MSNNYTVTLTDAQDKALKSVAYSPQEWIENFVFERCRIAIEEIVNAEVQRKLAAGEAISGTKEEIVLAADILSAVEKHNQALEEIANRQG